MTIKNSIENMNEFLINEIRDKRFSVTNIKSSIGTERCSVTIDIEVGGLRMSFMLEGEPCEPTLTRQNYDTSGVEVYKIMFCEQWLNRRSDIARVLYEAYGIFQSTHTFYKHK